MVWVIPHLFHCKLRNLSLAGGRQVDGALASLEALRMICATSEIAEAQEEGKFTVLFDSGIRSGGDIIKAMALGAQGVMRKAAAPFSVTSLSDPLYLFG